MHYAVRLKRKDLVKLLLFGGANSEIRARNGQTPQDFAKELREEDIVEILNDAQGNMIFRV